MLHNKQFFKKTKKGAIQNVVREHYLRDDIWSGSPLDPDCPPESRKLSTGAKHYLVVDTNVALHQMDFLEYPGIQDVIVCSVVLDEVKKRNKSSYDRLRALIADDKKHFYVFANEHHRDTFVSAAQPGETANDRNDRAIRKAAKWYTQRLPQLPVILLTNDVASRQRAEEEGLRALGVPAYAQERLDLDATELQDLVARYASLGDDAAAGTGGGAGTTGTGAGGASGGSTKSKRKKFYTEHKPAAELNAGLKSGKYHQGTLRASRFNAFEGKVVSESVGDDILLHGKEAMNRAIDGDVVVVELLPESEWKAPAAKLPTPAKEPAADEDEDEALNDAAAEPEGAEIFQVAPGDNFEEPSTSSSGKRPCGQVVGIIKRNWRTRGYCGSIDPPRASGGSTQSVLFVPVERRYPKIRLQTRQAATLADKRIVVVIDSWDTDSMYPSGHYVRTLGDIGDRNVETEVLLIENDINTSPFTDAVHACVPPLPWAVGPAERSDPARRDLRHICVCSVDPPGCKDIDDALHVRQLENGNFEVGVHIADVTHFIKPNTAIDIEAASRATTTYLVDRRIDMLPKPLTEDICSLRGEVERLAFTVLWEMTPDAVVLSTDFTKSLICSRAALTYAEAQTRIDDERLQDDVTISLRHMNRLAKILRKRRAEAGALQLASPEVKFKIDTETQDPLEVGMYQVRDTNQMVEEMMLLANCTVAEKILQHFPACSLLRRHQTPPPRQFEPLLQATAAVGLQLDTTNSSALAASLDRAVRPDDRYFNKLVRIMCTRCMTQAQYFGSGDLDPPEFYHYGLAAPLYTHFTSPIRRYADVVVHRLLGAALGLDPLPDSLRDRTNMHGCADNINKRHHNAQLAGRASVELHTLIFFRNRTVIADARVTKVKLNGLVVFVPKFGIEGPVYLTGDGKSGKMGKPGIGGGRNNNAAATDAEEDLFMLDEERQRVTSRDGRLSYTVFDKCAVRIVVEESAHRRSALVLSLVPRDQLAPEDEMV